MVADFKRDIVTCYGGNTCFDSVHNRVEEIIDNIDGARKKKEKKEKRIDDIGRSLINDANPASIIRETEAALQTTEVKIKKRTEDIGGNRRQISIAEDEISKLKAQRQERVRKLADAQHLKRCIEYTDALIDRFEAELSKRLTTIRSQLDNEVKSAFERFGSWSDVTLSISDDYVLSCTGANGKPLPSISEAQSGVAGLSCITAILALGKQLVNEESESNGGLTDTIESVPLVMDAPLSKFDKERIDNFGRLIPETAEQLIIFIKDTDGDIFLEKANARIGMYYKLQAEGGQVTTLVDGVDL